MFSHHDGRIRLFELRHLKSVCAGPAIPIRRDAHSLGHSHTIPSIAWNPPSFELTRTSPRSVRTLTDPLRANQLTAAGDHVAVAADVLRQGF